MIVIIEKDQGAKGTDRVKTFEDACQILIKAQADPAVHRAAEYSAAWEHVHGVLCASGTRFFRRCSFPNPDLAGEEATAEWAVAMLKGGFANCDKTLPFYPFGWKVFFYKCANYGRTARRKRMSFLGLSDPESRQTNCPSKAEELSENLRRALDCLPLHFRNAVVSKYFDGLSSVDAAAKYGTTPSNMDVRRCRGRKMLAVLLQDFAPWPRQN
jgi:DNA-directed RNA polymerase specialized sigma24 family protein